MEGIRSDCAEKDGLIFALDKQGRPFHARAVGLLLKVALFIYDAISYIPIKILADPAKRIAHSKRVKAAPTVPGDPSSPWRSVETLNRPLRSEIYPDCDTVAKVWDEALRRFPRNPFMGTREVVSVKREEQADGRVFEKFVLDEYQWQTYEEVAETVTGVAKALSDSQQPKSRVVIYSETRAEWMITALACWKSNCPFVTVYATLGQDALTFATNECEAAAIFTSASLLPTVTEAIRNCASVNTVVYYSPPSRADSVKVPPALQQAAVSVKSFEELVIDGHRSGSDLESRSATADDLAYIMYTSGTTGNPKGVMMTHRNVVTAMSSLRWTGPAGPDSQLLSYLPLAHVFEVCMEVGAMTHGARIGYSSPQTMFEGGGKLAKGQKSDAALLRPTYIAYVPAIMERMFKAVCGKLSQKGAVEREVFRVCYERALTRITLQGYPDDFINRIVFRPVRQLAGGEMRTFIGGGAPLSLFTERFMQVCFGCQVVEAFGLTECQGAGTMGDPDHVGPGNHGVPLHCCEIMLREWTEGGYSPHNEIPQGEILIGGDVVSPGYYNNEAKTRETFPVINGKRWLATGDIGEFTEDGVLNIIDRKKDLLKLSTGEYVSPVKTELVLQTSPIIESVFVHGASGASHLIALISPNAAELRRFAKENGVEGNDVAKLSRNQELINALMGNLQALAKGKLNRTEIPQRIHICEESWTPESGLLTTSLKLKRPALRQRYQSVINDLYK